MKGDQSSWVTQTDAQKRLDPRDPVVERLPVKVEYAGCLGLATAVKAKHLKGWQQFDFAVAVVI
jgi:hypothetical protein